MYGESNESFAIQRRYGSIQKELFVPMSRERDDSEDCNDVRNVIGIEP